MDCVDGWSDSHKWPLLMLSNPKAMLRFLSKAFSFNCEGVFLVDGILVAQTDGTPSKLAYFISRSTITSRELGLSWGDRVAREWFVVEVVLIVSVWIILAVCGRRARIGEVLTLELNRSPMGEPLVSTLVDVWRRRTRRGLNGGGRVILCCKMDSLGSEETDRSALCCYTRSTVLQWRYSRIVVSNWKAQWTHLHVLSGCRERQRSGAHMVVAQLKPHSRFGRCLA